MNPLIMKILPLNTSSTHSSDFRNRQGALENNMTLSSVQWRKKYISNTKVTRLRSKQKKNPEFVVYTHTLLTTIITKSKEEDSTQQRAHGFGD